MPEPLRPIPVPSGQPASSDRLESWKDIAAYLGREVRTVQLWEKNEGLPVHRHQHARQGSVYAFKSELDAWRKQRANSPEAAAALAVETAPASTARFWRLALLAGVCAALLAVLAFFLWKRTRGSEQLSSVVVLPFVDMSPGKDQEYFSDGLTEEIIDALSRVPNLHVVARTSAFQFKGKNVDIREIGRQLNVAAVLEGSVRKSGDQLRITAQLNRVTDGFHLWSRTFDRPLRDIFAVQREISQSIANQLGAAATAHRDPTANLEAYRLYLEGRFAMSDPTEDHIKVAIACYHQALEKDPNYALAYAGLADTYSYLGDEGMLPPREVMPQAKANAQKALALDDSVAEAHASLGIVALLYEWDWATADKEFRRALDLSPGNAYVHHWYGHYYDAIGRYQDGRAEMKKALALDPLSEMFHMDSGFELAYLRQPEASRAEFQKVLDLNAANPFAMFGLAYALERTGHSAEALAELQKMGTGGGSPILMGLGGTVYARLGKLDETHKLLAQFRDVSKTSYAPPFFAAMLEFALHEPDQGFSDLEKAYQDRSSGFTYMLPDPIFDGLRSDPRFVSLMNKTGVPPVVWSRK